MNTDKQLLEQALEALAPLEKLFTQADEQGLLSGANVDCQIATNELRKSAYAASDIRAHPNTAPPIAPVQEREAFLAGYEAAQADAKVCHLPPHGWRCTRTAGHDGPCAAVESPEDTEFVASAMKRLREATPPAQPAPAQEPIGKLCVFDDADSEFGWSYDISGNAEQHRRLKELDGAMIYITPPTAQRQWVGLTDEEVKHMLELFVIPPHHIEMVVQAIEAKLMKKNGGAV
jgi:hypothetical protein